jgi:IclR family transcriptional regulator, KDG regulon repressor
VKVKQTENILRNLKNEEILNSQIAYKSVSHIAKIFSRLSEGRNSVTEIAKQCELSNATVCRLLKALEQSNFVVRDPIHRKYYLGPFLNHIVANPQTTHLNLIALSLVEMNRLSEICGETVVLSILIGLQNIRLHTIPGRHNVRIYDDEVVNITNPRFQGAGTKTLLSQLSRRDLILALNNIESKNVTGNTSIDKNEFIRQLSQIKKQGYAISRGERIVGALMISAPVKGYHFPAVLSVVGVESRLEPRVPELLPEIIAGANHISQDLPKPFQVRSC